jgi:hypothetical protein
MPAHLTPRPPRSGAPGTDNHCDLRVLIGGPELSAPPILPCPPMNAGAASGCERMADAEGVRMAIMQFGTAVLQFAAAVAGGQARADTPATGGGVPPSSWLPARSKVTPSRTACHNRRSVGVQPSGGVDMSHLSMNLEAGSARLVLGPGGGCSILFNQRQDPSKDWHPPDTKVNTRNDHSRHDQHGADGESSTSCGFVEADRKDLRPCSPPSVLGCWL